MCKSLAYVAFNKATNGHIDIKHEKERMMMAWYMKDETNKKLQSGGYKKIENTNDC